MSNQPGFNKVITHIAKNHPEGKEGLMAWIRDVVVLQKPTYHLVLVGPHASGKSSFHELLTGLPLPFSLTVFEEGEEVSISLAGRVERVNKITCAPVTYLFGSDPDAVVVNCGALLHSESVPKEYLFRDNKQVLRTIIDFEPRVCEV